ncbi:MAG: hypothetical protein WC341_17005 [Bacteroidales bacterium]|jgi:hypothetical protein
MKMDCTCGNPDFGLDCVCKWVKENPGQIEYSCEHCGIYTASKPRCNRCEGTSSIIYAANEWGYVVRIKANDQIIEEFNAGNSKQDEQTTVQPGSIDAHSPSILETIAKATALQWANNLQIPATCVQYNDDLQEELEQRHSPLSIPQSRSCRLRETHY